MKKTKLIFVTLRAILEAMLLMLAFLFYTNLCLVKFSWEGDIIFVAKKYAENDFKRRDYRFYVPMKTDDIENKNKIIGEKKINEKKVPIYSYYYYYSWLDGFFVISFKEAAISHVNAYNKKMEELLLLNEGIGT